MNVNWRLARCNVGNPAISDPVFFGRQRSGKDADAAAKQICSQCPIKEGCLEYALENMLDYGIWGGWSGKERRAERSRRSALARVHQGGSGADVPLLRTRSRPALQAEGQCSNEDVAGPPREA